MATTERDIYETTFDEDVQIDSNANQCPECGGRVTTTTVETVCDDCGLVISDQSLDPDSTWRSRIEGYHDQCGPPAAQGTVSADE